MVQLLVSISANNGTETESQDSDGMQRKKASDMKHDIIEGFSKKTQRNLF